MIWSMFGDYDALSGFYNFLDSSNTTGSGSIWMLTFATVWIGVFVVYLAGASSLSQDSPRRFWNRITRTSTHAARTQADSTAVPSSSLDWWDDLAPPFAIHTEGGSIGKRYDPLDDPLNNTKNGDDDDMSDEDDPTRRRVTHVCFLVHGHRGQSQDLGYLEIVMQSLAAHQCRARRISENTDGDDTETWRHDMVVHNAICNQGRTTDGVTNGGERLVEEMLQVMKDAMQRRCPTSSKRNNGEEDQHTGTGIRPPPREHHMTVSVVGNSLGGIYGRYAVAQLAERLGQPDGSLVLDSKYPVHLNIFCTTATPHLGISKYTYLPLPRTAEIGMAHAMGDTGRDLFRVNDLMKTMATSPKFLKPLGAFRKRICYANAYGTDFPVPAGTAAFLSDQSRYPHHFALEEQAEGDDVGLVVDETSGLVIATMHTPPRRQIEDEPCLDQEHEDELALMSTALDALGWTKVFVDVRQEVPGVTLPRLTRRRSSNNIDNGDASGSGTSDDEPDPLDALKQRGVVESRDVATAVKLAPTTGEATRISLPIGHNMLVAFSRSRISTLINKAGRPVVDSLARELVEDIFKWNSKSK